MAQVNYEIKINKRVYQVVAEESVEVGGKWQKLRSLTRNNNEYIFIHHESGSQVLVNVSNGVATNVREVQYS